jgi:cytochrome c
MRILVQGGGAALLGLLLAAPAVAAAAVDEADAQALMKASKCLTCHSIDKKKDGPAYKDVAAEYRDDADAQQKIIEWLSSEHEIEIDGEPDSHPKAKTSDVARIGNLAAWVLSR